MQGQEKTVDLKLLRDIGEKQRIKKYYHKTKFRSKIDTIKKTKQIDITQTKK